MNSVGQLKEYHDKYPHGNPPGYTFLADPNTKLFSSTCSYRNRETSGVGTSKKDSQRAAADKMLKILNVTPRAPVIESVRQVSPLKSNAVRGVPKVLTEDKKLKACRFLAEYNDNDPNSDARNSMAPDQCIIDDLQLGLKSSDAPKSDTLASGSNYADAIDTFKEIMKEMKLKFCCKIPEIKRDTQSDHIVLIQINHKIRLMAGGTGFSVESATYAACDKAIAMLKIYTN